MSEMLPRRYHTGTYYISRACSTPGNGRGMGRKAHTEAFAYAHKAPVDILLSDVTHPAS